MLIRRIADSIGPVGGAASCAAIACGVLPMRDAHAGYGAYTPGNGAQSTGAAGIAYAVAQDTTPLSANPALARQLGGRADFTLEYDGAYSGLDIKGNLLGPDQHYESAARNFFFPQGGIALPITEDCSFGATGFLAGFGSRYKDSPLARFGAADQASLSLSQAGISMALAYELIPEQTLGLSLNLSYDLLEVKGLSGLPSLYSQSPQHFSDQGKSGVPGLGFTIGWHGELNSWLAAGAGYRSKSFAQGRFKEYEGLLPDQGRLAFPAIFGGGLALTPLARWIFVIEAQHVGYKNQPAFANPLSNIQQHRFGAHDGPGFGWKNQTIERFAVIYMPTTSLTLRAGYSRANEQMPPDATLLGAFAPDTGTAHYSLGATWSTDSGWEFTGAAAYGPAVTVHGRNSIPTILGGGEADLTIRSPIFDLEISRRFHF